MKKPIRFIRRPEVEWLTGLSRSTIYRLMAQGEFPKNHRLSPNCVGWDERDIKDYNENRIKTA